MARRLFLVAFSDFCCWFPVGVMGLLAVRGTAIPGEVNVYVATLVLPLNSALNPFLYTLTTVLDKRRKGRELKRRQATITLLLNDVSVWTPDQFNKFLTLAVRSDNCNQFLYIM